MRLHVHVYMHTSHCPLDGVHHSIHNFLCALELQVPNDPVRLEIRDAVAGAAVQGIDMQDTGSK